MSKNSDGPAKGAATIKEENEEVLTSKDNSPADELPGRELTNDHLEWLASKHAVKPEVATEHARSIATRDDMPEDVPISWTGYRPTIWYRWQCNGSAVWQARVPDDQREEGGP